MWKKKLKEESFFEIIEKMADFFAVIDSQAKIRYLDDRSSLLFRNRPKLLRDCLDESSWEKFRKEVLKGNGAKNLHVVLHATSVSEDLNFSFSSIILTHEMEKKSSSQASNEAFILVIGQNREDEFNQEMRANLFERRFFAQQELFESILENLPNTVFLKDADNLRFEFVNRAGEELFGMSREHMIGKLDKDLFPTDQAELFEVQDRKAIESGCIQREEKQAIFTPMGERWWRTKKIPVLDRRGTTRHLLGIIEEVSLVHQQTEDLKETNRKLYQAQKVAKLGSWSYDVASKKISWTEQMYEIFSENKEGPEPSFEKHRSSIHPSDVEHWEAVVRKCLEDGRDYTMQFRTLGKEGEVIWIRASGQGVKDSSGNVISLHGTCQDITEIVQAQEELEGALFLQRTVNKILDISDSNCGLEEKLENSLELLFALRPNSPNQKVAVFTQDEEYSELSYFTGDSQREWSQDLHWGKCICGQEIDNKIQIHKAQGSSKEEHLVLPLVSNDMVFGWIYWLQQDGSLEAGDIVFWDTMARAIGDLIRKDRINKELELQKQAVQQSAKMASIGELAAGVGHEINNPLAIAMGYLDMLGRIMNEDNPVYKEASLLIGKIDHAAQRIANIVNGLRTLARTDKSNQEDFDLELVLQESVNMVKDIYAKDGIQIEFYKDADRSMYIHGSRGKIQQVLMNLISNAKDATEGKSERLIQLGCSILRNKVIISVKDNGVGIKADIREKIFDPFFTTKETSKGVGIGLSLVYNYVKEHGGHINLISDGEAGTEFLIDFPLVASPAQKNKAEAEAALK